jgi:hypothetical protein
MRGERESRSAHISFSYSDFEHHFLWWLKELDWEGQTRQSIDVDEITGRLAEIRAKADKIQAAINAGGEFDRNFQLLQNLAAKEKALQAEVAGAYAANAQPLSSATQQSARSAIRAMERALGLRETDPDDPDEPNIDPTKLPEIRLRLRQRIQALVGQIRIWTYGSRTDASAPRLAVVDVALLDGRHRYFVIRRQRGAKTISVATSQPIAAVTFNPDKLAEKLMPRLDPQIFSDTFGISNRPGVVGFGMSVPPERGKLAGLTPEQREQRDAQSRKKSRLTEKQALLMAERAKLSQTLNVSERVAERLLKRALKKIQTADSVSDWQALETALRRIQREAKPRSVA